MGIMEALGLESNPILDNVKEGVASALSKFGGSSAGIVKKYQDWLDRQKQIADQQMIASGMTPEQVDFAEQAAMSSPAIGGVFGKRSYEPITDDLWLAKTNLANAIRRKGTAGADTFRNTAKTQLESLRSTPPIVLSDKYSELNPNNSWKVSYEEFMKKRNAKFNQPNSERMQGELKSINQEKPWSEMAIQHETDRVKYAKKDLAELEKTAKTKGLTRKDYARALRNGPVDNQLAFEQFNPKSRAMDWETALKGASGNRLKSAIKYDRELIAGKNRIEKAFKDTAEAANYTPPPDIQTKRYSTEPDKLATYQDLKKQLDTKRRDIANLDRLGKNLFPIDPYLTNEKGYLEDYVRQNHPTSFKPEPKVDISPEASDALTTRGDKYAKRNSLDNYLVKKMSESEYLRKQMDLQEMNRVGHMNADTPQEYIDNLLGRSSGDKTSYYPETLPENARYAPFVPRKFGAIEPIASKPFEDLTPAGQLRNDAMESSYTGQMQSDIAKVGRREKSYRDIQKMFDESIKPTTTVEGWTRLNRPPKYKLDTPLPEYKTPTISTDEKIFRAPYERQKKIVERNIAESNTPEAKQQAADLSKLARESSGSNDNFSNVSNGGAVAEEINAVNKARELVNSSDYKWGQKLTAMKPEQEYLQNYADNLSAKLYDKEVFNRLLRYADSEVSSAKIRQLARKLKSGVNILNNEKGGKIDIPTGEPK